MNVFLTSLAILAVLAVLGVLFHVSRTSEPVGSAIGFLCAFLANVFVSIKEYMEKSAVFCKNACTASLRFPPGITDGDYWQGVIVLSKNVFFVVASCCLGGEIFGTLEVVPSLFQSANHFAIPGITELSLAAVIVSTPALWGSLTLECLGVIHGCGLFPRLDTLKRWVLGVLSLLMTVAAILLYGYFYVYRRELLTDPQSAQDMTLYLFSGLGILTASSAVLALYALVVGGAGVVSLLLLIAEVVCTIIAALVSLPINLLNVVSIHVSGMDVTQKYSEPVRVDLPPVAFQPHGQTSVVLLPERAASKVAQTDEIVPIETPELEKFSMAHPEKTSSIDFIGEFGSRMVKPVAQKVEDLRAIDTILTSGWLDLGSPQQQLAIPGTVDVSPTYAERKTTMIHGATEGETYTALSDRQADKKVAVHLESNASPGALFIIVDARNIVDVVPSIVSMKRRLPFHSLVVVTSISESDVNNPIIHTGIVDLQSLDAEDIIETVIVLNPRSDFAARYGEETQRQFFAEFLVSLILSHKHNPSSNRSCTSLLQELHTISPFTTCSFASAPVAVGDLPKKYKLLPGIAGKVGLGDYSDILSQARECVKRVLTDEETRAFNAEVNTETPCFVVVNVPIQLSDRRFNEFARDINLWAGANFPFATCITVRGNGCALPYHLGGRYKVQATCFYPVQPASFPRMQGAKTVKITPLYPVTTALEPVSSNSPVPTSEKKAVNATPRSKKAAPARRVGRKNSQVKK